MAWAARASIASRIAPRPTSGCCTTTTATRKGFTSPCSRRPTSTSAARSRSSTSPTSRPRTACASCARSPGATSSRIPSSFRCSTPRTCIARATCSARRRCARCTRRWSPCSPTSSSAARAGRVPRRRRSGAALHLDRRTRLLLPRQRCIRSRRSSDATCSRRARGRSGWRTCRPGAALARAGRAVAGLARRPRRKLC